jgi:murein DD-endopeptidase MepM/ murein hydrolase activator NlpD
MVSKDKFIRAGIISKLVFSSSRKTKILSAAALALAVCAFGAAGVAPLTPDASDMPVKSVTQAMALPNLSDQLAEMEKSEQYYVREERVRPGDTLATLLNRLGVDDDAAAAFIKTNRVARNVLQLKPGKQVQVQTAEDGELQWLSTPKIDNSENPKNILITRSNDGFKAAEAPAKLERRVEMRSGEIKSSLFAATDSAQIPDTVAKQIISLFSTDIDFASELHHGDRFNIVYESFWQNGELVRTGRILAGEFTNGGETHQSVWFDAPGGGGYFGFDGQSLKKAFLKSPLEFTRISSGFSMREHPISGEWKQHKGVDFAAPTGTPIRASGDAEIEFIGEQSGYGNVIFLKHWSDYSTVYAHMSAFAEGMKKGMKIHQGDVIGYVGSTGWATGPHLHYEFRINNEPHDPLSVDVPNAQPLVGAELQRFRALTADMTHRFALLRGGEPGIAVASR